jgi:NTE family protein
MRVGLVLGAGGSVGAAWLIGALDALESETGWRPSDAERIVGTSAGSAVGALIAQGYPPALMAAYAAGEGLDDVAEAEHRALLAEERIESNEFRLQRALPPIGPGSWRLALNTLRAPHRHNASAVLAGWLPRGFVSTAPIRRLIERFIPAGWPAHDGYWAVAADYTSGRRVAFGRDDAPPANIGQAVAASCCIPGFYHPVKIGERRYIDGGICSPSNLDLLCGEGLDLVVCLNPMSSPVGVLKGGSATDRLSAALRAANGRRVGHEARKLREAGTRVLILHPGAEDCSLMGLNLMRGERRVAVTEQARRSVARDLRRLRSRSELLPSASPRPLAVPAARRPTRPAAARRAA